MVYDLISIGSVTKDIFILTDRGKIFKTPKDKLAPEWLGFELGEKICVNEIIESAGGVAINLSKGTGRIGLRSVPLGPAKTATSMIVVDQKTGERVIFYQKSSGIINFSALKNIKAKWLSVSSLTGNWTKPASIILSYIKDNNSKLILAPSTSMIREGYKNLKRLLAQSEIIILNKNEATEISFNEKKGTSDVKNLLKLLHGFGPSVICLTDGIKGAWASDGKKTYYSPIKKVKSVDSTGAGDAFASGFLGFHLKGATLETSLKAGIVNSASVVKHVGTTMGLLNKKEILKLLN
jgi:sugar/nucleoside kinase (ribokinase family)